MLRKAAFMYWAADATLKLFHRQLVEFEVAEAADAQRVPVRSHSCVSTATLGFWTTSTDISHFSHLLGVYLISFDHRKSVSFAG